MNTEMEPKPHQIIFFIDKEKFSVDVNQLTVRELIVDYAKEDPMKTTLGLKEGNQPQKYQNLDEVLDLKNGMHFVVFHNDPTTVS